MTKPKFKYWDGEFKQMCDVRAIVWHNNMIANIELFDSKTMFRHPNMFYEHALLQYTGRKDSNGREIYEGNILRYTRFGWRCPGHPQDNTHLVTYYKVIWDEAECAFKVDNKNMTGSLCFDDSRAKKNEVELIGNIYENPELLRGD